MIFTSDNASAASPEVMAAVIAANEGFAASYGAEDAMSRVTDMIRDIFAAPNAAVYLVPTGTAANALAIAAHVQPWQAIFAHKDAHIEADECGAPEFFTGGAKLVRLAGDHGKIDAGALAAALSTTGQSVHGVQKGLLSLTNVTEAGTVYTPFETAALAAIAHAHAIPVHLDGARFAGAAVATGAHPADLTWRAGVDVLSFGGTKNGCLGVEAVVMFNPAKAWEFELRRKRAGHLFSKQRYLSAQMEGYLQGGAWLERARHANTMAALLADGLTARGVTLLHPVQANIIFAQWPAGTSGRLRAAGATFYDMPASQGYEAARLVASWSTTAQDVEDFLGAWV
ncbi:MAG: beta-eliminating lyase-related protein [Cypionkella sp.]|nr:beta-eliminating lyase-related protein [Cypionkella sp.]